ncbi:MAG: BTAD domain-containing putative transcriptional regulator [Mycobacterium sp.]
MSTVPSVELGVLGPLQVRQDGAPVAIPGAKPRAILTMLGLHNGSVVSADTLIALLWGDDPPRTAAKALQTHISSLRRALGDGVVVTEGTGWTLQGPEVDATRYKLAAKTGRDAAAAGDTSQAVARFEEALALWRGIPELPEGRRGTSEKTRWIEGYAALVEDRADALLATGRAAELIGELEGAVADAPLRERRWGQLMLALYRAGRQGEALGAYQRARALLAEELGVDPGPDLRRLEAAIVAQDSALETPAAQHVPAVTRAVTFLLSDIEGSTAAWETDADAMAVALARHDELVEQVVTSRGGRLIKTRGEGDATFSVFERPSAAATAAIELQQAISGEPWALREPMRIRVALHTGEVEFRDGDYFGRAVNRAARLRSLAAGGQILCSGATAELVIDSLPDDVVLADLGTRELRNLARPERVFELRLEDADNRPEPVSTEAPLVRPLLPAVLAGPGPFVGRGRELAQLFSAWQTALSGATNALLIAGEPGVGKTRLAGEWSRQAYDQGALVIYGRCDEDLGAPYQPFAEALRSLVPCLGASKLRGLRGVEALLTLVPGLTDVLPDLPAPTRADPDTERYALFDAVVAVLGVASTSAPVVLILDDLHWAAKPTLLLLRHLLRFGEQARVQILGTYRSTDLDRSHPLAGMLADLHRDGTANRIQLSGLDEDDVTAYVAEAGYHDEELARALASVTGGNPFFLIEALRHVDESGGKWDPSTLPQGVREAVSRRLSRLPAETNKALAAAAVVGSRFALELVEHVVGGDLVDAFDEACKAGIVIEEPGGRYRFNHALVRQSLLAELPSVRRMRLHQRIAATLENQPGADDERLAELAHHYFECAWAGNAVKAVEYCRRAADQAMARLAYEGAADLYDRALHALEEIDDELPDRDEQIAALLVARCEALLATGDVASAAGAVSQLQEATRGSVRLAAWAACFDGQLSMLVHPDRLDEVEAAVGAAAGKLAELDDTAGEAKAHTVRAGCLARLGRIGDCEIALDDALTAARRAREHRRVNAVLANAPLAALWGPNPVPRAGGRCLDVVRLLRITTDSPAVEATSTRCQAVLEAFRGRAAAARRMIDSARRTVTELGLRHALLEVEQFAGIVELVMDDPAAAEPHLRQAYNGFRRMGLDADTAETAALLGRTCLALDREDEADELCTESEHLAGNALKASIAWRTLRAKLLSRRGAHDEARRVAEAAVSRAECTDALVDHGDACLALATVLDAAGDARGARAAAERAADLYERKGAAALAEKARRMLGERDLRPGPTLPEPPIVELDNACARAIRRVVAAVERGAWDELETLHTPHRFESRRKIVGFTHDNLSASDVRAMFENSALRLRHTIIAVRGERLALARFEVGTPDETPGAPHDEILHLIGLDEGGRIALEMLFDLEDIDAATAELEAAHARFEHERPRSPLENAASRADDRFNALFADRRWDEIGALLTDDIRVEDRRRGLGREGNDRATELAELRAIADLGTKSMTSDVLAIRGERLALVRTFYVGRDKRPEAFHTEVIRIAEIDAEERIVAYVAFDAEDFEAAIAELDARYLAGEAAAQARTWSVITQAYSALNRRERLPTTPDWVNIDHRRGMSFGPGELPALLASWNLAPDVSSSIEVVHQLNNLGAVVTSASRETSQEGVNAEWRVISVLTVEGDLINRCEVFDEADLAAALTKFDQLSRPAPQLQNAASRVYERFFACFATRDWAALAEIYGEDVFTDDRRPVVGAGLLHGREVNIANMRAVADVGTENLTSTVISTRGERLALSRVYSPAFLTEVLNIIEIDADERIAAVVAFDPNDFEAAIAELDARYLAGEAAANSQTWSVIARAYAELNRQQLPATTPDFENIDHRRVAPFAPGDHFEYLQAAWDLGVDVNMYIDTVHQLSDFGAVITHTAHGTSHEGSDVEWHEINLLTVEGDKFTRCELFDEGDVDAALARFEQLSRPKRRLENAATRVCERLSACFAAREWDAVAERLADDVSTDDRRRVVGEGIRPGRDAVIAEISALADLGVKNSTSEFIATRGSHLVLRRFRTSGRDQRPEQFHVEVLDVIEINADERIAARVVFDLDDFDAAIAELDARYLAGEASAYAHTWSVITGTYSAINRHELPELTPDHVNVDHRRIPMIEAGEGTANVRAGWEFTPDLTLCIEAVHRLSNLGAVVTRVSHGTSQGGLDAEWRAIDLLTVGGGLISRGEIFDEADLDTALARFDQLSRPPRRLQNTASQVAELLSTHFAARDWGAIAETLASDISTDDRRRVVGAGLRQGRDAVHAELSAVTKIGVESATSDAIATRGEHLVLNRARTWGRDQRPEAFLTDMLSIVEINGDEQITALVTFDLDDFEAAIAELDARYLAGEASAYAHTWSVITGGHTTLNRRELPPTTTDLVSIDHRRGPAFAPGEGIQYLQAGIDLDQDIRTYVEVVHRLSDLGAVCTHVGQGISREGFDAEWRGIDLLTVTGDSVNRCEVFDEADLDAALAKFEQLSRPAPQLENAATRVWERLWVHFAARDWDATTEVLANEISTDDRRPMVGAGVRHGRDAEIANLRAIADIGITSVTSTVIATRGERLALSRDRFSRQDQEPGAFPVEVLAIVEINADNCIAAGVAFEPDDIEAAFEELDARFLTGEGAAHANTWSVIAAARAALIRHELPPTTPDWVNLDHRRGIAFPPGDFTAYLGAGWDQQQGDSTYIDAVHQLNNLGAVFTQVVTGTSQDGFDAEWRVAELMTVEGGLVNRAEFFDDADLDAALAKLEQLSRPPQLENAASQAYKRFKACFAARDWDGIDGALADEVFHDDRRWMTGAGLREGRDAVRAEFPALAEIGVKRITSDPVATRGRRLLLSRSRASGRDQRPDAFRTDVLNIVEIDTEGKIAALITFDSDDFEAAIAELDALYLAGEAAAHAHTWSVITRGHAAVNRRELPSTTTDLVSIDHRRSTSFAPGELIAYFRAGFDLDQDIRTYVEIVHRLSELGAVCTHVGHGVSREGFDAEWRGIDLLTVDGGSVNRCEVFDEADLNAALAAFDQLSPPAPRLENMASQIADRVMARFTAREWNAAAEMVADDFSSDDRRRTVNAGIRRGRDAAMKDAHANADLGAKEVTSTVVATRGERLVLRRARYSSSAQRPEAFHVDALSIYEINGNGRLAATVTFDIDDIDAALEELDARYLTGEAARYAHTWSAITSGCGAFKRNELPPMTPSCVTIDHRRASAFAPGDFSAYLLAGWDLEQDMSFYIETVHRLSDLGGVITGVGKSTSQGGFDAEWRTIDVLTFEGDMLSRCELFDEADLDAALARFEELHPQARRLENASSRIAGRYLAQFAAGNWDAMAEMLVDDYFSDDRRRVVGSGLRHGRDAQIADMRAIADLWITNVTSTVIATRGERLALTRTGYSGRDQESEAFRTDALAVGEINADGKIAAAVAFDPDNIDAAFEELDARYLAGEAANHSRTWSVITGTYTAVNQRRLPPMTPDFVFVDHLPVQRIEMGDLAATIRAMRDLTPDISCHIEAVHRLSNLGAVVTRMASGTSQEGFDAEWRQVDMFTVEGDKVNRCEVFAETDIDAALARFEELHPQAPRLENAASLVLTRFWTYFEARDWDAMAETLADDFCTHDRRRVVNAGVLRGRAVHITNMRAVAEVGFEGLTSTAIATRGQRLALIRFRTSLRGSPPGEVLAEVLGIVEIDPDNRLVGAVMFDSDDIDAAFEELDARYLAGEAAAHSQAWSVIVGIYAAFNRHELSPTTHDWVNIDHRRGIAFGPGEMTAYIRAGSDLTPDSRIYIETVHRLSNLGAVVTQVMKATSRDGFDAEWREIGILTIEGDLINRCEMFDETDLDAATARFEELDRPARRLKNKASRAGDRFFAYFGTRNWAAIAEILADDSFVDDRRRVVNAGFWDGRDVVIANMRALEEGGANITSTVVATRGERLALTHICSANRDQRQGGFGVEMLGIAEIDTDERIAAHVLFDVDDIDAAFEELDARYLAGEAAAHSHAWSVNSGFYAGFNRHELPATTPDWIYIDHRPLVTIEANDLHATMRAIWDLAPDISIYMEAVHRLSDLGAVVTAAVYGSSQEGFDAEWRMIDLFTVEGDLASRCEIFDEADLDAALARFEELQPQAPRLENAASQLIERFQAYFAARNWAAIAEISADEIFTDDRRSVVSSGILRGRDIDIANIRAIADLGAAYLTSAVIATRGKHLALAQFRMSGRDQRPEAFHSEMLGIVEIDADNRVTARILFDLDDIDAAFEELDNRYLADEAADHAHAWSVIAGASAAFNRHELPAADGVIIDHRRLAPIDTSDLPAAVHAIWDLTPDLSTRIEAVHRLSSFGAVVTYTAYGTSTEGFAAEWRMVDLLTVEGDRISRFEFFDEADLHAALARFDDLSTRSQPK